MTRFESMYKANLAAGKYVCVGLDPDMGKAPVGIGHGKADLDMQWFVCGIIDATCRYAAAFKLQSAYYEALGSKGIAVLEVVVDYIRHKAPNVPIILDYKRGDIDRTAAAYVEWALDNLDVDAVTVNPYLGMEAMRPFLDQVDKHIFVLAKTSNDGGGELQDVLCCPITDTDTGKYYASEDEAFAEGAEASGLVAGARMPFYQFVALRVARNWNYNNNCGLVVGATKTEKLGEIRRLVGDMLILVPGIGTQGGDLMGSIRLGQGNEWLAEVFNNSSAIMFAQSKSMHPSSRRWKPSEWKQAAAAAARNMNESIAALV
jgi:orotidine-5'-phosphate decarboxylase